MTLDDDTLHLSDAHAVDICLDLDHEGFPALDPAAQRLILDNVCEIYGLLGQGSHVRSHLLELVLDYASQCPGAEEVAVLGARDPWWPARCDAYELLGVLKTDTDRLLGCYRRERHPVALGYCAHALACHGGPAVTHLARRSLPRTRNAWVAGVWLRYLLNRGESRFDAFTPVIIERCVCWSELLSVYRDLSKAKTAYDVQQLYAEKLRDMDQVFPPDDPLRRSEMEPGLGRFLADEKARLNTSP